MATSNEAPFVPNPDDALDFGLNDDMANRLNHLIEFPPHYEALWPESIWVSFVEATKKSRYTDSNQKNQSNHWLWKQCVTADKWDFDGGIWVVLRAIYFDSITRRNGTGSAKRLAFKTGAAAIKITQVSRYQRHPLEFPSGITLLKHYHTDAHTGASTMISRRIDKVTEDHIQRVNGIAETAIAQSSKTIAGEVKKEMQPWIDQQMQVVIDTTRKDMQSHFDTFKTSLKPWITQQIQAEVSSQLSQEMARKVDLKRKFEAFKEANWRNGP
ncbi:hypothetical protein FIE12Z_10853 [Fusarium flagelliforme]|uniref:Uncharacterized protein n=1 Tax=Fusarium flagelliforme TaxID=2675880 RepID=A0A395MAD4_9HYPO|nr:hypothetical protein FIE12Z_10853 [Fusarium flagelliforme]